MSSFQFSKFINGLIESWSGEMGKYLDRTLNRSNYKSMPKF